MMLDYHEIEKMLRSTLQWVSTHVLVTSTLVQGVVCVALLAAAWWLARRPKRMLDEFFRKRWSAQTLERYNADVLISLTTPLFAIVLLTISGVALQMVAYPDSLLVILAKLISAWVIIRLSTAVVRHPFWSQAIALSAWTIAALSIIGLLEPVTKLLEGIAFEVGNLHVSLLDIVKGILTLIFLLWLANSFSRMIEMRLFSMRNLTPSAQVLLSKVMRITLIVLAALIGINSFGIDLTALAVFSGAIGLGLGFGLQKVVSNFISGIILLLDRSVKPGDVIELVGTYGWVNKLGARYVSVLTRDGVEHLIPNESLITERVTNWSYSSTRVRLHIPIGISYDSDVHLAIRLILEAANRQPRVLKTPESVCRVMEFGDSAINLELRIWINDPIQGVNNIRSDILLAVWDLFKEHGVRIPFPQRDIHIKEIRLSELEPLKAGAADKEDHQV